MKDVVSRLKERIAQMESGDPALASELKGVRGKKPLDDEIARRVPFLDSRNESLHDAPGRKALETIVLCVGRPVLAVQRAAPLLQFQDAESEVWRGARRAPDKHPGGPGRGAD